MDSSSNEPPRCWARCSHRVANSTGDRYNVTTTLVTSQLDLTDWHAVIGDATVAKAICERLVHGAHRLTLRGESLRKAMAGFTTTETSKK